MKSLAVFFTWACLSGLLFFCLPGAGAPGTAQAAVQDSLKGIWQADLEATAKVYQLPRDLEKDLAGLLLTFDLEKQQLVLLWADGSSETRDCKVTDQQGERLYLRVSDKYEVSVDVLQKEAPVLLEGDNSLVLKRPQAAKP